MLNYANSFTCTMDDKKETMIIRAIQQEPRVVGSGSESHIEIESHEVASIITTANGAAALVQAISSLLNPAADN